MNRVMKDSGIEWIGNIPQEWEIIKINMFSKEEITRLLKIILIINCYR